MEISLARNNREKSEVADIRCCCFAVWEPPSTSAMYTEMVVICSWSSGSSYSHVIFHWFDFLIPSSISSRSNHSHNHTPSGAWFCRSSYRTHSASFT